MGKNFWKKQKARKQQKAMKVKANQEKENASIEAMDEPHTSTMSDTHDQPINQKRHDILCQSDSLRHSLEKEPYSTLLKEIVKRNIIPIIKYIFIAVIGFFVSVMTHHRMLTVPIQQQLLEHVVFSTIYFVVDPKIRDLAPIFGLITLCLLLVVFSKEFIIILMSITLMSITFMVSYTSILYFLNFCCLHVLSCAANYYWEISHIWLLVVLVLAMCCVYLQSKEVKCGIEDVYLVFVISVTTYYKENRNLPDYLALSVIGFLTVWLTVKSVGRIEKLTPVTITDSEPMPQTKKDE